MKTLKFTRKHMMKMFDKGYTSLETSLEKFEIFKAEGYPKELGYFNANNCALCENYQMFISDCDKCPFVKLFNVDCTEIFSQYGNYEGVYKALEVLYLHELLTKKEN